MTQKSLKILDFGIRVAVALVFLQTLFYKFSAHKDSVFIFSKIEHFFASTLGIGVDFEPTGRVLIGVFELFASILLLVPRTKTYGSYLALQLMLGAVFFHLIVLGITVNNDGGLLFGMAVFCIIGATASIVLNKKLLKF